MSNKIKTLKAVKCLDVSAEAYLEMVKKGTDNVQKAHFIPPVLGQKGFGTVKVTFKDKVLIDA